MWLRYWWTGHPFHLPGHRIRWCFFCCGWGDDPSGYECALCHGQGWQAAKTMGATQWPTRITKVLSAKSSPTWIDRGGL